MLCFKVFVNVIKCDVYNSGEKKKAKYTCSQTNYHYTSRVLMIS